MERIQKKQAIEQLHKQIKELSNFEFDDWFSVNFQKWHRDTTIAIQNIFVDHPEHLQEFNRLDFGQRSRKELDNVYYAPSLKRDFPEKKESAKALLESMIDEINEYWNDHQKEVKQMPIKEGPDNFGFVPVQMNSETKIIIPKGYSKLKESIKQFINDFDNKCNNYNKNVFIMTRFRKGNETLENLDKTIRGALDVLGLCGHRADNRCYPIDRNLWDNVCTYMICCKYGIAVLENIIEDEFNPNVALEYGFMRALGKPTLLLKEKRFKPRADILGTIWEPFDILNLKISIWEALRKWAKDLGLDLHEERTRTIRKEK